MFQNNIDQLIKRFRVIEKEIKVSVEKGAKQEEKRPLIEFNPNYFSDAHELNEITKINMGNSGGRQFYIESSDY